MLERKNTRKEAGVAWVNYDLENSVMPEEIKLNTTAPDAEYEIEHVYGYRAADCTQNLRYNSKGEAVYMVACLGVVMDTNTEAQRFYGGGQVQMESKADAEQNDFHRDDIQCLDISTDRKTVVTGQVGKAPSIHVWDAESQKQICHFSLKSGARGVSAVSISPCGRYVAAVDQHNDHHVCIYNIKREKELLFTEGSKEAIFDVAWSKKVDDLRFATLGAKEIKFWHAADVTKRLNVKGTFGQKATMTNLNCLASDNEGWFYTGGANGHIHMWADNCQVVKSIKAHADQITAMIVEGGKLVTGGKDNKIQIFSAGGGAYKHEKTLDLNNSFPKSIDILNNKVLVGLRTGTIIEINEAGEQKNLLSSHHEGEAWGLELLKGTTKFATSGDDNKFLLYDYETHRFERQGEVSNKQTKHKDKPTASTMSVYPGNKQSRALAYSPKWGHIAVASNYGKVSIRDFKDFDTKIQTLKNAEEWCEMIKYSPCEKYLATGSHDNQVYVYEIVDGKYHLYKNFNKHSSYVQAFDWSLDSTYIRSADGAYDKLYFNITTKQQDSAGLHNTKDMEWASHSVKLGWDVHGVHPHGEDGTHVNHISVTNDKSIVASGDDFGLVNIYRYPCNENTVESRSYAAHSEHVLRVEFTEDGKRMFTIGGQDKAIIQWKKK